jgi:sarcosine oxidase, subunit gamma
MAEALVSVSRAPAMQRWSLRARHAKQLEQLLGVTLPTKIGDSVDHIACLGPDEWLWRSASASPKALGQGQPLSIVNISERSVGFLLEGSDAGKVLNAGCPLDLERFAVGRCTRTVFDGIEIILSRESETRWAVDVWRSYAEFLWLSFNTAAQHQ